MLTRMPGNAKEMNTETLMPRSRAVKSPDQTLILKGAYAMPGTMIDSLILTTTLWK